MSNPRVVSLFQTTIDALKAIQDIQGSVSISNNVTLATSTINSLMDIRAVSLQQTQIDDLKNVSLGASVISDLKSVTAISFPHQNIHNGVSFKCFHNNSSLASGSSINIYFETNASTDVHLVTSISGSDSYDFEILEAPTVTSATGSALTIFNKNRNSATASTVHDNTGTPVANQASTDVTVTADGTIIWSDVLGNKSDPVDFSSGRELILKNSTKYVFRLTSRAAANRVHINLDWYEL